MILILPQLDTINQSSNDISTTEIKKDAPFSKRGVEYTEDRTGDTTAQKEEINDDLASQREKESKSESDTSSKKEVSSNEEETDLEESNYFEIGESSLTQHTKDAVIKINVRRQNGIIKKEFDVQQISEPIDEKSKEELSTKLQLLNEELRKWVNDKDQTNFPALSNKLLDSKSDDNKEIRSINIDSRELSHEDVSFGHFSIFDDLFNIFTDSFFFPLIRFPLNFLDNLFVTWLSPQEINEDDQNEFEKQIKDDVKIKDDAHADENLTEEVNEEEIKAETVQKQQSNEKDIEEKKKITDHLNNDYDDNDYYPNFNDSGFIDEIELIDEIEFIDAIEFPNGTKFWDEIEDADESENQSSLGLKERKKISIKKIHPSNAKNFDDKKDFISINS